MHAQASNRATFRLTACCDFGFLFFVCWLTAHEGSVEVVCSCDRPPIDQAHQTREEEQDDLLIK